MYRAHELLFVNSMNIIYSHTEVLRYWTMYQSGLMPLIFDFPINNHIHFRHRANFDKFYRLVHLEGNFPTDNVKPLASWPNPRHKNPHTIIQYVTSSLNQNIVECSRGQFICPWCHTYASVNRVSIGSDNGLSHFQPHTIIRANARLLSTRSLGTNFSKNGMNIHKFSFTKMQLNGILSRERWVEAHGGFIYTA